MPSPEITFHNGELFVSKRPFWLSTLVEIERNSLILKKLKIALVPQYPKTEKFYKRFADIINFMADRYLEKVPDGNFYVLIFPEGEFDAGWIKYCDKRVQIISIPFPEDYNPQNSEEAGFQLPGDGHPTLRMNSYVVDRVLSEIKQ